MTENDWVECDDVMDLLGLVARVYVATEAGGEWSSPRHGVSDRKLRLFAAACCRRSWELLTDERSRRAVKVGERFADGLADENVRAGQCTLMHWRNARGAKPTSLDWVAHWSVCGDGIIKDVAYGGFSLVTGPAGLLRDVVRCPLSPTRLTGGAWRGPTVMSLAGAAYEARSVRCERCGGSGELPYPLPFEPYYEETEVCAVCGGAGSFNDGTLDPALLSVLADAMEDGGCVDEPVLRHLRGWERCRTCLNRLRDGRGDSVGGVCEGCDDSGWVRSTEPHVKGCWALDLVLGKE